MFDSTASSAGRDNSRHADVIRLVSTGLLAEALAGHLLYVQKVAILVFMHATMTSHQISRHRFHQTANPEQKDSTSCPIKAVTVEVGLTVREQSEHVRAMKFAKKVWTDMDREELKLTRQ